MIENEISLVIQNIISFFQSLMLFSKRFLLLVKPIFALAQRIIWNEDIKIPLKIIPEKIAITAPKERTKWKWATT